MENILKYVGGFEAMVKVGNYLFAMASYVNLFVKIDIRDGQTEIIGAVPGEDLKRYRLYYDLIAVDNLIFFSPLSAKEIAVYNILDNSFNNIPLRNPQKMYYSPMYKENYKLSKGIIYNGLVYFFSCTYPAFVIINPKTLKVEYKTGWLKNIEGKRVSYSGDYSRSFWFDNKDTVYFPLSCWNGVAVYKLQSDDFQIYSVGTEDDAFCDMVPIADKWYLSSKRGRNIIICDKAFNQISSIEGTKNLLSDFLECNDNKLILYEYGGNNICCFGRDRRVQFNILDKDAAIVGVCYQKGIKYIIPRNSNTLFIIDEKMEMVKRVDLVLSDEQQEAILSEYNISLERSNIWMLDSEYKQYAVDKMNYFR